MPRQTLVELLVAFGPTILSGIGVVLMTILTAGAAMARAAWKAHEQRMRKLADAIMELTQDEKRLWEVVQGVRAELALSHRSSEGIKAGLLKVEGALESHQRTLYSHIEKLGRVEAKLEAVFRFMDAPARASDKRG